jgi:hypothetical protein
MRFLRSWAMLALLVSAGAAFYELSPSRVRMIDVDAEMASRGIDRAQHIFGPSVDGAIQALGGDPEGAIDADEGTTLLRVVSRLGLGLTFPDAGDAQITTRPRCECPTNGRAGPLVALRGT